MRGRFHFLFLLGFLTVTFMSSGFFQVGWASVDSVETFGLVETGELTKTSTFNKGSVVYVRVYNGSDYGNATPFISDGIIIRESVFPYYQIKITVYDDGTFPDNEANDGYYWGKFRLEEGDGSGTDDTGDIIQLEQGEQAEIRADPSKWVSDPGSTTITADYAPEHTKPEIGSFEVKPTPFSPNDDGIN